MSNITTKQSVLLKGLSKKTVVAQFDQDHASADGGAVLLKACDERLGLSASLAACLSDKRQPGKAKHSLQELFQRYRSFPNVIDFMFARAIASGFQRIGFSRL